MSEDTQQKLPTAAEARANKARHHMEAEEAVHNAANRLHKDMRQRLTADILRESFAGRDKLSAGFRTSAEHGLGTYAARATAITTAAISMADELRAAGYAVEVGEAGAPEEHRIIAFSPGADVPARIQITVSWAEEVRT